MANPFAATCKRLEWLVDIKTTPARTSRPNLGAMGSLWAQIWLMQDEAHCGPMMLDGAQTLDSLPDDWSESLDIQRVWRGQLCEHAYQR